MISYGRTVVIQRKNRGQDAQRPTRSGWRCARAVYADAIGGRVYHYRDHNGLECDTVIHLPNGHYGLVGILRNYKVHRKPNPDTLDETRLAAHCPLLVAVPVFCNVFAHKKNTRVCGCFSMR